MDALFSPVLSFLASSNAEEEEEEEEEVHAITDEDVAMAEDDEEEKVPVKHIEEEEEEELHHDMGDLEETPSSSFDEEEFNPYLFIKSLPSYNLVRGDPRTCLPPKATDDDRMTLVLDLDETLVHCTVDATPNADLVFPVFFHGMEYQVHVRLRPHLYEFLESVHDQYEVVVFTASQKVYADELLNRIDPRTYPTCCVSSGHVSQKWQTHLLLSLSFSYILACRRQIHSPPSISRILSCRRRKLPQGPQCLGSQSQTHSPCGQFSSRLWIPSGQWHSH